LFDMHTSCGMEHRMIALAQG